MVWQDELKENMTSLEEIQQFLHLSEDESSKIQKIIEEFPMSITRYYLSLIDPHDEKDPIRKMCIPSLWEQDRSGLLDTSGEISNTKLTGLQHKYNQTALLLSTNQCASYCRHCFRKRLVGLSSQEVMKQFDEMVAYIKAHKEISNVLISGGDSFMNENAIIKQYLKALCALEHLDFIRFGTRTPVVFPQRISEDEELLEILKYYNKKKQIYVVTHFNHPKEVTKQASKAVSKLLEIGIPVKNQSVLLRGVNDDPKQLATLLKELTKIGVVPYYIFQCRPVMGVKSQFQVPIEEGYKIVEATKHMQNGQGKCFKYCMSHESGKIEILGNLANGEMLFKYNQAKHKEDQGKLFALKLEAGQTWL